MRLKLWHKCGVTLDVKLGTKCGTNVNATLEAKVDAKLGAIGEVNHVFIIKDIIDGKCGVLVDVVADIKLDANFIFKCQIRHYCRH